MFTVFIIMFVIHVGLFLNEIKMRLIGDFFSLSKKTIFFMRVAYFLRAANLKYFDKLLKKNLISDFKPFN